MRNVVSTVACAALIAMGGCGGDSGTGPDDMPSPTPPPTPTVAITSAGDGALVLHPSLSPEWGVKLYVPIRIQETAGGTATWNYARLSLFRGGMEVERGELGADVIAEPPSASISSASS